MKTTIISVQVAFVVASTLAATRSSSGQWFTTGGHPDSATVIGLLFGISSS